MAIVGSAASRHYRDRPWRDGLYREAVAEGFQRLGQISLRHEHIAHAYHRRPRDRAASRHYRDRPWRDGLQSRGCRGRISAPRADFPAPRAIADLRRRPRDPLPSLRIGLGETVSNGEAVAEGFQASARFPCTTSTSPTLSWETERSLCHPALPGSALARRSAIARLSWKDLQGFGQISLRHEHIAHPIVGDREIALPAGVARIGLGETVCNGEAVLEGLQGFGQIALRHEHIAHPIVGDRQIPLPAGVARIGLGETV